MKIGYARTSTLDQRYGLEGQLEELKRQGCEKVFQEQLSSVDAKRPSLETAIDFAREGDVFVVTRLDRLARSISDLMKIQERLAAKSVALIVLSPSLETETAAGRLQFNILASIAQFEREIMLERQREGIERAKLAGKYKGRHPTAMNKRDEVLALFGQGLPTNDILKATGISRASFYRIKRSAGIKSNR